MSNTRIWVRALSATALSLAAISAQAQTTVSAPPAGRLLASNCFQCHGYNGRSSKGFEILAGESASEIYNELKEMRQKTGRDVGIMEAHTHGYTDAQLKLIATYLSKQTP